MGERDMGVEVEDAGGLEVLDVAFFGLFFFVVDLEDVVDGWDVGQVLLVDARHSLHVFVL